MMLRTKKLSVQKLQEKRLQALLRVEAAAWNVVLMTSNNKPVELATLLNTLKKRLVVAQALWNTIEEQKA